MAKPKRKARPDSGRTARPRIGPATVVLAIVTLATVGTVLWLAMSADTTMAGLRAKADRNSLQAEVDLLRPSQGDAPGPADLAMNLTAPAQPAAIAARPEAATEPDSVALPPAPVAALIEETADGPLPRVAADGRTPWQVYARPFDASDSRPRIAIVITEMGHTHAATNTAIHRLPGPVTLAFTPYAPDLDAWLMAAREAGHETLMMVPMEPDTYPRDDPGPHTLLTSLGSAVNMDRLEWVLSRGTGYVGVVTEMGSRFTLSEEALAPVLAALDTRGLLLLDNGAAASNRIEEVAGRSGLPRVRSDRFVDAVTDRDSIDLRLQELEELARENGFAVGLAHPYPLTFERLAAWMPTLERKGVVLAPVTAVANRQTGG